MYDVAVTVLWFQFTVVWGSGVARPMKLVGHEYGKWSLKLTTPPN